MSNAKIDSTSFCFLDSFSSLDDLKGKDRRDTIKILAALAKAGRFSCFDVDNVLAKPITAVLHSGWVKSTLRVRERDADGFGWHERDLYPWTLVELTDEGRSVLANAGYDTSALTPHNGATTNLHDPQGVISEPKGNSEMQGRLPRNTEGTGR